MRRENHYRTELMISEVTQEKTYKAIGSLKYWKALGSDEIPAALIKYSGK